MLGRIDQEYIRDPDLREVLAKTDLDNVKTDVFEDQQLSLRITVIFSERFEVKGKRRKKVFTVRKLFHGSRVVMNLIQEPFCAEISLTYAKHQGRQR